MDKFDLLPQELKELVVDYFYEYLRTKANIYLDLGPEKYRSDDFLNMPLKEWDSKTYDCIEAGSRQINNYGGLTPETAFTNLGIDGFYKLMAMFHYRILKQSMKRTGNGEIIDKMIVQHSITGKEVILFNLVKHK
jgi:hypothetical protein